ncbi:hypothetical protein N865_04220 [Intrasporangium oryzae NRRL B-24470]|uniref:Uncharacterized protein n=1 Tax=Intrasporangium oryzae NRRL B-24470 TaxID=1386089 RepID=W9G976_9MICO|nr:hypothetical protein [Intrasporangium oryzae]EWT02746.1 hypothetical protein N865_04220 [Intrasporangium oryzae NRRL B-24470]
MSMNDLELRAALREEADHVHVTGDFAGRAIALDRRRGRQRIVAGAAAAAAVVAVAIPVLWSAGGGGPTPMPAGPTSQASTASPEPTRAGPPPTYRSANRPLVNAVPKLGPATGVPEVAYAVDGVLHDGDRSVRLPIASGYAVVSRLAGGGVLVQGQWGPDTRPYVVDGSGMVLTTLPAGSVAVASRDGARIAWTSGDAVVHVMDASGAELARRAGVGTPRVVAGGRVYALPQDGSGTVEWDSATGAVRRLDGTVRDVDASGRRALVLTQSGLAGPDVCYALLDLGPAAPTTVWTACGGFAPLSFSPKGTFILGTYTLDGAGPAGLAIARADDARVVLGTTPEGTGAWSATMNEAETAVTFSFEETESRQNALVRCTLDGTCTVVGSPRDQGAPSDLPSVSWVLTNG